MKNDPVAVLAPLDESARVEFRRCSSCNALARFGPHPSVPRPLIVDQFLALCHGKFRTNREGVELANGWVHGLYLYCSAEELPNVERWAEVMWALAGLPPEEYMTRFEAQRMIEESRSGSVWATATEKLAEQRRHDLARSA